MGSLTQFQKSVIIGTMLGDGYIRTFSGRKNALLEINHSIYQKEYVDWKYTILKNIVISPPKVRQGNGTRIAYRFYTKQLSELSRLQKLFYENRIKKIPLNLSLDKVSLAVWYMDDGSKCRSSDIYLNTQQFGIPDQEKLISALGKLGLKAKMNKDKNYFRLRFLKSSISRLKMLVEDTIIPSMRYKIEL